MHQEDEPRLMHVWVLQFIRSQIDRGSKHEKSRVKIWAQIGES